MGQPSDDASIKGLIRELANGAAGWGVRLIVSIAAAFAFAGACGLATHLLAAMFPHFDKASRYNYGGRGVRPDEQLSAFVFLGGALLYLVFLAWLWSRGKRGRGRVILFATVGTVVTIVFVAIIGVLIEEGMSGDESFLIAADVLFGFFIVFMIWLQAYRKFGRGRPTVHREDGKFDIRCPKCNYRMVGLSESTCPECGEHYTLDQLLSAQDFRREARRPVGASSSTASEVDAAQS